MKKHNKMVLARDGSHDGDSMFQSGALCRWPPGYPRKGSRQGRGMGPHTTGRGVPEHILCPAHPLCGGGEPKGYSILLCSPAAYLKANDLVCISHDFATLRRQPCMHEEYEEKKRTKEPKTVEIIKKGTRNYLNPTEHVFLKLLTAWKMEEVWAEQVEHT